MIMAYPNYYNGGYYPQYQNGAVPDMLNQYKGQYQQSVPQMQQNIPTQPMQMPIPPTPQKPANDIIWVQGLEGAKGYLVAPNNTVVLWDTENPVIYVKSADANGMPSMRVLDFTERNADASNSPVNAEKPHKCTCGDKFVTKEEFDALKGKFYDILTKYDGLLLEQKQKEKEPEIEKPKTSKKAKESEE
jgi:hypothetical protein